MIDFIHRTSLQTRVLLLTAALLLAGIWGIVARTTAVLQADLERSLSEQMLATVTYVAADIDAKLQLRLETLNEIAATVTPAMLAEPGKLRRHLAERSTPATLFPAGIFAVDRTGTIIADHPALANRAGSSVAQLEYFRAVMAAGKPVFGTPLMGRFSKRVTVPLGVPLRDASGAVSGMLAAAIFPADRNMFGLLDDAKIGKTGNFLVVSPQDRLLISATDKSRIMQPLPPTGVNPLLDQRVERGTEGAGITVNSLGTENLSVNRNIKTTGWFVLANVSTEEAFAPIATLKRQIYLAALLMTVAIVAVLRFVLTRQLAPLANAGARMQRMTRGEEAFAALPIARRDEIGRLVENFNQLVAERIRLDESLREEIGERQRKTMLMQLLESLARATNEATTPEVAMQSCVERICAYGGWDVGHVGLYAPGQASGVAPTSLWKCSDPARFAEFTRFSDGHTYSNSWKSQFVGQSMRERKPVWIEDMSQAPRFGRLDIASKCGIRSGFVFPIVVGGDIAGFLEFFATDLRAPDQLLIESVNSVASQLARSIERSRAAAGLAELNADLERRVASRTAQLEASNRQLSSFTYTVAHDLRAPLRAINGFAAMLLKSTEHKLDPEATDHLQRIHAASRRMGTLIDDLLNLSRISREEIQAQGFSLSEMSTNIVDALADAHPARQVTVSIQPGMNVTGDPGLLEVVCENLIGNAWKFTAQVAAARIEIGAVPRNGQTAYYVRDNGVGFDMAYAHKLFQPFQRLHHAHEFEGTGIGLATAMNIVQRHGGTIWIESTVDAGTTVFFTLGKTA